MAGPGFCAGPWAVEPTGLRALGNEVVPWPAFQQTQAAEPELCAPRGDLKLCELFKAEVPNRVHANEVDVIRQGLASAEDDCWELLAEQAGVSVHLVAGEPRNGCVTLKATASLPGLPVELAADQLNNMQQRMLWDQYVRDVTLTDIPAGEKGYAVPGQCMYFVLHAPPFADRDFVTQVVTMKSRKGDAYLTYTRSIEHEAYPAGMKNRVRARLDGCMVAVRRDPKDPLNSSQMLMMTRQDIKLPFVPVWFINRWAPSKLADFVNDMRRRAESQRATRTAPPSLALFALFQREEEDERELATAASGKDDASDDGSDASKASTQTPTRLALSVGSISDDQMSDDADAEPKASGLGLPTLLSGGLQLGDKTAAGDTPCDQRAPAEPPKFAPDLDSGPAPVARPPPFWSAGSWLDPWTACAMSPATPSDKGSCNCGAMSL